MSIKIAAALAGICRTDIDVRDGYLPTPTPVVLGIRASFMLIDRASIDLD